MVFPGFSTEAGTTAPSHKSYNALKYSTMHHFITELYKCDMWTFLWQNDTLWDMGQVHCGICELSQLKFVPWGPMSHHIWGRHYLNQCWPSSVVHHAVSVNWWLCKIEEWSYQIFIYLQPFSAKFREWNILYLCAVSTMPVDGLVLLAIRTSAGTLMT